MTATKKPASRVPTTPAAVKAWAAEFPSSSKPRPLTAAEARTLAEHGAGILGRYGHRAAEAEAAFTMAYRVTVEGPDQVVEAYGHAYTDAMATAKVTKAALRQAMTMLVAKPDNGVRPEGLHGQAGFARVSGLDRITVHRWMNADD